LTTLSQIFSSTVELNKDKEAIVYGHYRLTWQELSELVDQHAVHLKAEGVTCGDTVGLWLASTPFFVINYLAILKLGACVMPLNISLKFADLLRLKLSLKFLITSNKFKGALEEYNKSSIINIQQLIVVNDDYQCLKNKPQSIKPIHIDQESNNENLPAVKLFSGGTTGISKQLIKSHVECVTELKQSRQSMGFSSSDSILCILPLNHAHGMANAFWASIGSGAKLVFLPNELPIPLQLKNIVNLLKEERVTVFPAIPFIFDHLAKWPYQERLPYLRLCFSAGIQLKEATYKLIIEKFNIPIRQLYGCTEAGAISINMANLSRLNNSSVGKGMKGVTMRIVDERGHQVANNDLGAIEVKSRTIATQYANGEKLSFVNGWYRTGDMGRLLNDGDLIIEGRKELMLDVAGYKFFANEVECLIEQYENVVEAAITQDTNNINTIGIKAYVVVEKVINERFLSEFCKNNLPSYKCPQEIEVVETLPKNSMGKLQRHLLG